MNDEISRELFTQWIAEQYYVADELNFK